MTDIRPGSPGRVSTALADPAANEALAAQGYAVLEERLEPSTVGALSELYESVIAGVGRDGGGEFRPSMSIRDPHARARLWDGVRELTKAELDPVFASTTTELIGGSFVSKPATATSQRKPHQDPTVFDERRFPSMSFWVPLSDSTIENGTLHVLPGSHRMGNLVRPPGVDSFEPEVHEVALSDSIPIELEAGQILALDGAVVHHSPPNRSNRERIAAICAVRTVGAEMHLVQSDERRSDGTARMFAVGIDTYRSGDLIEPELDRFPLVATVPYRPATMADLARSRGWPQSRT